MSDKDPKMEQKPQYSSGNCHISLKKKEREKGEKTPHFGLS